MTRSGARVQRRDQHGACQPDEHAGHGEAATEAPLDLGTSQPRSDLFVGSLLRGLPAREPGSPDSPVPGR
jgi:hypothetical protein